MPNALLTALVSTIAAFGTPSEGPTGATPALWSVARAESQVQRAPPSAWVRRGWDVVAVVCDGVGPARRESGRRVYRNFSCEISVVKASDDCPSSGTYTCVAAFEATALERTLHVIDGRRYALYRQS